MFWPDPRERKMAPLFLSFVFLQSAACASIQGQVGKTRFIALPEIEAAAIPKMTEAKSSSPSDPGYSQLDGQTIPILGEVVFGSPPKWLKKQKRSFFYCKDPKEYLVAKPQFVSLVQKTYTKGILTPTGSTLENNVGVEISTGGEIPIDSVGKLQISLGPGSHKLELRDMRIVKLNMMDFDYISTLADLDLSAEPYFVSALLVSDVFSASNLGLNLTFRPNISATESETAAAVELAYKNEYSGLGLIVGVELQRIIAGGTVSYTESTGERINQLLSADTASKAEDSKKAPSPSLRKKLPAIGAVREALKDESGSTKVMPISLGKPFRSEPRTDNVRVTVTNPMLGGIHEIECDGTISSSGFCDLLPGEHEVRFVSASGNRMFALGMVLSVRKENEKLVVFEYLGDRRISYIAWREPNYDIP